MTTTLCRIVILSLLGCIPLAASAAEGPAPSEAVNEIEGTTAFFGIGPAFELVDPWFPRFLDIALQAPKKN